VQALLLIARIVHYLTTFTYPNAELLPSLELELVLAAKEVKLILINGI